MLFCEILDSGSGFHKDSSRLGFYAVWFCN